MKTVRPLGLYIHIPFCKAKCVYCDFYSLPHGEDRMDAYTDALCAHLTEAAPLAASHTVDTVYFGGGTPSYLGEKRLCKILKVIEKRYQVARDAEITLEANPDSTGDWKALRALRRCGFNRISLGMQSACDEELRTIGRVHTMEQVQQAVEAARKAKIQNHLWSAPRDGGAMDGKSRRCRSSEPGASELLRPEGRGRDASLCHEGHRRSAGRRGTGGYVPANRGIFEAVRL